MSAALRCSLCAVLLLGPTVARAQDASTQQSTTQSTTSEATTSGATTTEATPTETTAQTQPADPSYQTVETTEVYPKQTTPRRRKVGDVGRRRFPEAALEGDTVGDVAAHDSGAQGVEAG